MSAALQHRDYLRPGKHGVTQPYHPTRPKPLARSACLKRQDSARPGCGDCPTRKVHSFNASRQSCWLSSTHELVGRPRPDPARGQSGPAACLARLASSLDSPGWWARWRRLVEHVDAGTTNQGVVSTANAQRVLAVATQQLVDAVAAGQLVVPQAVRRSRRFRCGTAGNDRLTGTLKPDVIIGLGGNDVIDPTFHASTQSSTLSITASTMRGRRPTARPPVGVASGDMRGDGSSETRAAEGLQ